MASLFIADAEVAAGVAPLSPVGPDTFTSGSELGEQMGELMQERSLDFFGAMIDQQGIQGNQPGPVIDPSRAAR